MSRKDGTQKPQPRAYGPNRREVVVTGSAAVATLLTSQASDASEEPPENRPVQAGDRIQFTQGSNKGEFVRPDLLVEGERPIQAFPFDPEAQVLRRKYRLNRLLVMRLDPAEMDPDTSAHGAEGVLVYSAVCTHRGCTIDSWKPEERILRCHCHLSEFSALEAGGIVSGPAKRQLAMVPLELDADGYVVATEGFTRRVGGDKK